jgi:hypothetical protein
MDDCDPTESSPLLPGGGRHVQVMLDGPYGGCSLDLGAYEDVLLVAGGSGMTFVLGVLDDLVGRIVNGGREHGERTRRVEVKWCIRSFGGSSLIPFLTSILMCTMYTCRRHLLVCTLPRRPRPRRRQAAAARVRSAYSSVCDVLV